MQAEPQSKRVISQAVRGWDRSPGLLQPSNAEFAPQMKSKQGFSRCMAHVFKALYSRRAELATELEMMLELPFWQGAGVKAGYQVGSRGETNLGSRVDRIAEVQMPSDVCYRQHLLSWAVVHFDRQRNDETRFQRSGFTTDQSGVHAKAADAAAGASHDVGRCYLCHVAVPIPKRVTQLYRLCMASARRAVAAALTLSVVSSLTLRPCVSAAR